jgi:hypothetical protein
MAAEPALCRNETVRRSRKLEPRAAFARSCERWAIRYSPAAVSSAM